MTIAELAAARRTHKTFGREPLPRETLLELLELARLAPNHHLTEPWRFRVLGPAALARLQEAGGPSEAAKLERAPTLVVASVQRSGEAEREREDALATACAVYAVLLGAHARGLASYWRTPGVLRTRRGREALEIPNGERVLGLLHFGPVERTPSARERSPVERYVEFLD